MAEMGSMILVSLFEEGSAGVIRVRERMRLEKWCFVGFLGSEEGAVRSLDRGG